jgi:hypothetical protein
VGREEHEIPGQLRANFGPILGRERGVNDGFGRELRSTALAC